MRLRWLRITLTVVLKRVLADRRQAEDGQAAPAAAWDGLAAGSDGPDGGAAAHPVAPDLGERRLGLFVVAIAVAVVLVVAATLTRLPGLRGSPDPSALRAAPAASSPTGGVAPAGETSPGPAGTPTSSVVAPPPAGGPINPAATPGRPGVDPATGVAAAPTGPEATAGPGTAGPATTAPAGTAGPGATAEPVPTGGSATDVQAALADLSAAISQQVEAGRLDPVAGSDLQGKVHQVAREVSEGDWGAARYYADRIRYKLRKYRDDGRLTSTGYQVLIARLDVVDDALS